MADRRIWIAAALLLAGCGDVPAADGSVANQQTKRPAIGAMPDGPGAPRVPDMVPQIDRRPGSLDRSPEAARKVVRQYLKQRFAGTADYRGRILRMRPTDAGAGSIYQTVDVEVSGRNEDGSALRLVGPVVLRHVNDVDGASIEQLLWHVQSAELGPVKP